MLKPHLADVDCQVADGIATVYSRWQMLLPSGKCYSHNRVMCFVLFFFFVRGRLKSHESTLTEVKFKKLS